MVPGTDGPPPDRSVPGREPRAGAGDAGARPGRQDDGLHDRHPVGCRQERPVRVAEPTFRPGPAGRAHRSPRRRLPDRPHRLAVPRAAGRDRLRAADRAVRRRPGHGCPLRHGSARAARHRQGGRLPGAARAGRRPDRPADAGLRGRCDRGRGLPPPVDVQRRSRCAPRERRGRGASRVPDAGCQDRCQSRRRRRAGGRGRRTRRTTSVSAG